MKRKRPYIAPEYGKGTSHDTPYPSHYDIAVFTVEDHAEAQGGPIKGYPSDGIYEDSSSAQRYCDSDWTATKDAAVYTLYSDARCLGAPGNSGGPVCSLDTHNGT
ncbi:hypothetical protein [Streptomyces acidicola]|uniref:hypothetical protein n=1 Tax=Streptomyces acidicola TaxID=2596892 RepID=UPI00341F5A33